MATTIRPWLRAIPWLLVVACLACKAPGEPPAGPVALAPAAVADSVDVGTKAAASVPPVPAPKAVVVPQSPFLPSRDWKLAFERGGDLWVARGDGSEARRVAEGAMFPTWSGDGTRLAYVHEDQIWTVGATPDAKPARVTKVEAREHAIEVVSWNPCDDWIAFGVTEDLRLTPLLRWRRLGSEKASTELPVQSLFEIPASEEGNPGPSTLFDITADGIGVFFSHNGVPAWDASGKVLAFVRNGDVWLAEVDASDDDDSWMWDYRPWEVYRLAATGDYDGPSNRLSRENHLVTNLAWAPDLSALVYGIQRMEGNGFNQIRALILAKKDKWARIEVVEDRFLADGFEPSVTPDGKWVVYYSTEEPRGLHVVPMTGGTGASFLPDAYQPVWHQPFRGVKCRTQEERLRDAGVM